MTTAINANPSYFFTNFSNTIPVPELMIIAPNKGVHPLHTRCFTSEFRSAARIAKPAKPSRESRRRKGIGEGM